MDKIPLKALERNILGKKVKKLRREGLVPGHVYGNTKTIEHVSVNGKDFLEVFAKVGETSLVDLKIGTDKVKPVLIRGLQHHPVTGQLLHIDFFQVNLQEKVQVAIPVILVGEQPESVHMGETVVLQPTDEIQVEALPTDLIEKIEVDQNTLKQVDDAITVAQLAIDRSKITVLTPAEEVVIKLAPAITEEMKKLMEEQAAEAAAAAEAVTTPEGAPEGEQAGEQDAQQEGGTGETEPNQQEGSAGSNQEKPLSDTKENQ